MGLSTHFRMANRTAAFLVLTLITTLHLWSQEACDDSDITVPLGPQMVEADLSLLRGGTGEGSLPEWSKIEKLRSFFKRYTSAGAECLLIEANEVDLQLFIARSSITDPASDPASGNLDSEKELQFFGSSRVKVERADKQVTRTYAFPLSGPAKISEVAETDQLEILLEDLAQVQLVSVPRLQRIPTASSTGTEDCYLISSVSVVPSRVFDDRLPALPDSKTGVALSLDARRRALEHVGQEVRWMQRVDTELPGCRSSEGEGYWARQIRSLNLTVRELAPDMDYVAQSIRFWREVEQRIQQLRAEDEGWQKEIAARENQ